MALQPTVLNKTQTVMNENVAYFMDAECDIDIEGLATFGLDNGDVREVKGDNDLYLWALQIKDRWEGRPVRETLIQVI